MTDSWLTSIVTVLMAIVGVAIVAILVSQNANTTGVIGAGASGFSSDLATALSPITGASPNIGLSSLGGAV